MTNNPNSIPSSSSQNTNLVAAQKNLNRTKKLLMTAVAGAVFLVGIIILTGQSKNSGKAVDPETSADYQKISKSFGKADSDENFDKSADLNGDGAVSVLDYQILSKNLSE